MKSPEIVCDGDSSSIRARCDIARLIFRKLCRYLEILQAADFHASLGPSALGTHLQQHSFFANASHRHDVFHRRAPDRLEAVEFYQLKLISTVRFAGNEK